MSRYADFACIDCKVGLWLGKAILRDDGRVNYFKIGAEEDPPNSQRPELNRVLWKMLADHANHNLRVFVEGEPGEELLEDPAFVEIGGDEIGDLSFEDYLKDWHG
ncbi:MAG TPA: hypothetical protein VFB60_15045 [Ktedonobacteraceae bacterium]|nr:hypothetical protein [Ktedonobacteraceae bacterium]